MVTVAYYLISLMIIFISGAWSSLLPNFLKKNQFLYCIVFGVVTLILTSTWASYLGFSAKESSYFLLGILLLLNISIFLVYRKRIKFVFEGIKEQFIIIVLAIISGLIVMSPVILFNAFYVYNDGYTYISIADYLLKNGYFDKANPDPYFPWQTQMKLYQYAGFRMGAQHLLAFFTAIFEESFSITLYMPVLALGQSLFVIATWLFSTQTLKLPSFAGILASIFVAFHFSLPIQNAMDGFFPQAFAMGLSLLVLCFFYEIFRSNITNINNVVKLSLSAATLIITYSELVPFIVLACMSLIVFNYKKIQKHFLFSLITSILLTLILSNVGFYNSIRALQIQLKAIVGGNIPYTLWEYLQLILSLHPTYSGSYIFNQYPLIAMTLAIVTCLIFIGIIKYWFNSNEITDQKKTVIFLSLPYILMIIYYLFFVENPWIPNEKGQTWSIYKTVQYMFVLIPPIIGYIFYSFMKQSRIKRNVGFIFITGFIIVTLTYSYHYAYASTQPMRNFTGNNSNPMSEYKKLQTVLSNVDKPVNIIMPHSVDAHRKMLSYVLRNNFLISDWSNDLYISPYMENASPPYRDNGIYLVYNPFSASKIANMEIIKKDNVFVSVFEGNYDLEKSDQQYWFWSSNYIKLVGINTFENDKSVVLKFTLGLPPNVSENKIVELWYNNEKIMDLEASVNGIQHNIPINLKPGVSDITLKFAGQPVKYQNDPRDLAFSLVNFEYEVKE